jgi:hypothetical protein
MQPSRALPCLMACMLLSCTHDFSSFTFSDKLPASDHTPWVGGDSGSFVQPLDADEPRIDAAAHTSSTPDAAAAQDAMPPAALSDAGESLSSSSDAGRSTPPADASPGTADSDAGEDQDAHVPTLMPPLHVPTDAEQCVATWSADQFSDLACTQCACDQCTSPTLDCLSRGSDEERSLCTSLFACALNHGCHDWDCYCTTMSCRMGNSAPDGPCVAQMDAAAGGKREQVVAVHQANDPNQALVRAVRAIGCATGQSRSAVGGMMTGKCSVCARE